MERLKVSRWRKYLRTDDARPIHQNSDSRTGDAVRFSELEYAGLGCRFKEEVRRLPYELPSIKAWSIERKETSRHEG